MGHELLGPIGSHARAASRIFRRASLLRGQRLLDHHSLAPGNESVWNHLSARLLHSPGAADLAAVLRGPGHLPAERAVLRTWQCPRSQFSSLSAGLGHLHLHLVHFGKLAGRDV